MNKLRLKYGKWAENYTKYLAAKFHVVLTVKSRVSAKTSKDKTLFTIFYLRRNAKRIHENAAELLL